MTTRAQHGFPHIVSKFTATHSNTTSPRNTPCNIILIYIALVARWRKVVHVSISLLVQIYILNLNLHFCVRQYCSYKTNTLLYLDTQIFFINYTSYAAKN